MKALKVLILEDDLMAITDIKNTLTASGHLPSRYCRSVQEAIRAIENDSFDIAMIDIRLQDGESGIQFAEYLNKKAQIPFVFLTSHDEDFQFREAKLTNPAAYLIKPFKPRELNFQLELAYENFINRQINKSESPFIFLPFKGGVKKIDKRNVVFLKANKSSTYIYLDNQDVPEYFSVNLGYLCQFFSESYFVKISRSVAINLHYMDELLDGEVFLRHRDKVIRIPVSSRLNFTSLLDVIRRPKGLS